MAADFFKNLEHGIVLGVYVVKREAFLDHLDFAGDPLCIKTRARPDKIVD